MSHPNDAPPAPVFESKAAMYAWLAPQTKALVEGMSNKFTPQANLLIGLGNVAALCFYELNRLTDPDAVLQSLPVNWFGFYLLQAPGVLALGPFQGRPACTEIRVGRGVCGTAAAQGKALVVADVHEFASHIACDAASRSEVVVPICTATGTVLGVIDVDSQRLGHFDADDVDGLTKIATILATYLEFPMQRALAVNPSLVTAPHPPAAGGAATCETTQRDGNAPRTRIPHLTIGVAAPETTVKAFQGWQFVLTRLDRIATQAELSEMETELGISAFPEIQFPFNSLRVARERDVDHAILSFDVSALLRAATAFYRSDAYVHEVGPQLVLPVSEAWSNVPYARVDAKVDWAWRSDFFGVQPPYTLRPLKPGMRGINWDLLRDQQLKILLFDAFDFFEDDLHDRGLVRCSIKFRAMPTAFFILLRHLVRVDRHQVWMREVRYFHEFAADDEPVRVIVEEQVRNLAIDGSSNEEMDWHDVSEDVLSQRAQVISMRQYYVEV